MTPERQREHRPSFDGRIKPTLAAYYDGIGTTSQGRGYTNSFGGTSARRPSSPATTR